MFWLSKMSIICSSVVKNCWLRLISALLTSTKCAQRKMMFFWWNLGWVSKEPWKGRKFMSAGIMYFSNSGAAIYPAWETFDKEKSCPPGLEPGISCSGGMRLIHWATGTANAAIPAGLDRYDLLPIFTIFWLFTYSAYHLSSTYLCKIYNLHSHIQYIHPCPLPSNSSTIPFIL